MMPIDDWSDVSRILCVRLDALGDVLMTTPALTALRQSGSDRRLTLLTSKAGGAVAGLLPMVDQTIVYDAPWMKGTPLRATSRVDLQLIEQLRRERYDAAVIFTVYSQNPLPAAMLCFLAEIPRRLAHSRENPYQLLSHWVAEPEPHEVQRHEVERQLALVATIGAQTNDTGLSLSVRPPVVSALARRLRQAGVDLRRPLIVLHPGASAPSRRYPAEHFAAAARLLANEHRGQIVFTGSAHEQDLVDSICEAAGRPGPSWVGKTSLEELAALLSQASLLVSNNTGPVHLAAAVGTPIVDLYALTNPQHAPWQVPHELLFHDVPCKHCYKSVCPQEHHDCLRLVSPERVVTAARRLLNQGRNAPYAESAGLHRREGTPAV